LENAEALYDGYYRVADIVDFDRRQERPAAR
jgi:hypothetical protein